MTTVVGAKDGTGVGAAVVGNEVDGTAVGFIVGNAVGLIVGNEAGVAEGTSK